MLCGAPITTQYPFVRQTDLIGVSTHRNREPNLNHNRRGFANYKEIQSRAYQIQYIKCSSGAGTFSHPERWDFPYHTQPPDPEIRSLKICMYAEIAFRCCKIRKECHKTHGPVCMALHAPSHKFPPQRLPLIMMSKMGKKTNSMDLGDYFVPEPPW